VRAQLADERSLKVMAETGGGCSVVLDLPGVAKEDVKITIAGRCVSVSAQAQREQTRQDPQAKSRLIWVWRRVRPSAKKPRAGCAGAARLATRRGSFRGWHGWRRRCGYNHALPQGITSTTWVGFTRDRK
jgi:hypothetical protein